MYIATLGAYLWDILSHLGQEYRMLRKFTFSLPMIVYYTSRIGGLLYIVTSTAFQVSPVGHCQALQIALGWCYVVQLSSSSALFFLRARAIFLDYPKVVAGYAFLWFCNAGLSMVVPFTIQGAHIGNTNRCINTSIKPFVAATFIVSFVHDTLVFAGISYKFATSTPMAKTSETAVGKLRAVLGFDLPKFSKKVLQGGQQYYLITVGGNIVCMACILSPKLPPFLQAMFTIPNSALETSMACRVYREIKLGILTSDPTMLSRTTRTTTLPVFVARRGMQGSGGTDDSRLPPSESYTLGTMGSGSTMPGSINIHITNDKKTVDDDGSSLQA